MAIFSYPIYMHLEYISDRNYKQTKILQFYNIIIDESVIQFFSYFIWDLTQDFIFNSIETLGDSFGISSDQSINFKIFSIMFIQCKKDNKQSKCMYFLLIF